MQVAWMGVVSTNHISSLSGERVAVKISLQKPSVICLLIDTTILWSEGLPRDFHIIDYSETRVPYRDDYYWNSNHPLKSILK